MRKRWKVGVLAIGVLALAGLRAATLAQKPARTWSVASPASDGPKPERVRSESPADSRWANTDRLPARAGGDSLPGSRPEAGSRPADPVVDDPMGAVDSFLQRSRKEADESIKALSQEAEALRARLQKVEAALGRWQAVAGALNREDKRRWREPESEIPPQAEPVNAPKTIAIPAPGAEPPPASPPESPAGATLPSAEPAAPPSAEFAPSPTPTPR